jgi:anti-anti-sigma factor
MTATALEARVQTEDSGPVIELVGDVDGRAEQALDTAYTEAGDAGAVMLDFDGVTYMNSTGIALIVGLLARARTNGQTLSVRGLTPHYREIFEITRLADFMTIVDDEEGSA